MVISVRRPTRAIRELHDPALADPDHGITFGQSIRTKHHYTFDSTGSWLPLPRMQIIIELVREGK
jgi:hypothetical protein